MMRLLLVGAVVLVLVVGALIVAAVLAMALLLKYGRVGEYPPLTTGE